MLRPPARRTCLAAAAGLLALTGCSKPTPGVTLVSGKKSVHTEASNYCDGRILTSVTDCVKRSRPTVLPARQGDQVGIDVDRTLTTHGWFVIDLDSKTRYSYQDSHYLAFDADFTNRPLPGVINLEVREVEHRPSSDRDLPPVIGIWRFQLVQKA
jgi:hypothetical protein